MVRVLQHGKACLRFTSEQWRYASSLSADTSPGAVVAAFEAKIPKSGASSRISLPPSTTTVDTIRASNMTCTWPHTDEFFGTKGRKQHHADITLAIVQFVCDVGLALKVVDRDTWKHLLKLQTPNYHSPSSTVLMENHIMAEQEYV